MSYLDPIPTSVRISCVTRTSSNVQYEMISHVGGVNDNGTRWRLTLPQAIQAIDQGKYTFFVERPPGHRVSVFVQRTPWGHRYLKTQADGEIPNNLLSLPAFPP
jgi:hypothetical protein